MKKLLIAAAFVATAATAAQATDQDITLNATVPKFCTIGGSLTPTTLTETIPVNTTGNVVTTPIIKSIGAITCNTASTVTLSSLKGGLFDPAVSSAPGGFQNYINYSASIAAPVSASVTAGETSVAAAPVSGTPVITSGATTSAAVSVTINPTANTSPLVAGTNYADTLKVTIAPN